MSSQRGAILVKEILKNIKDTNKFERTLEKVKLISAGDGKCQVEFTVGQEHQNMGSTLHGGFTATLVDCISTYALMTSKRQAAGVSIDLHIKYLNAAFEGDEIVVDANTIKAGRTLAFLEATLKNKKTGNIIATGTHTKFIGGE